MIRRWKGVVVITLDEAQHAKCLASLRDRNGDLSTLRLQINALQEHPSNRKRIVVPKHYNTIQIAARKLHEALCEAWCCDDAAHRSHYAKLCLDAKVQSEVQLDLAISCHEPDMNSLGRSEIPISILSMLLLMIIIQSSTAVTNMATCPINEHFRNGNQCSHSSQSYIRFELDNICWNNCTSFYQDTEKEALVRTRAVIRLTEEAQMGESH